MVQLFLTVIPDVIIRKTLHNNLSISPQSAPKGVIFALAVRPILTEAIIQLSFINLTFLYSHSLRILNTPPPHFQAPEKQSPAELYHQSVQLKEHQLDSKDWFDHYTEGVSRCFRLVLFP